jgi:hypothetical protein
MTSDHRIAGSSPAGYKHLMIGQLCCNIGPWFGRTCEFTLAIFEN